MKCLTLVPVLVMCAVSGCGQVTHSVRVAKDTALTIPNGSPDLALIDKHCPFGQPQIAPELDHGPTQLVTRQAYALEHDSLSKIALWVCGSLDSDLVFGDALGGHPKPAING